MVKEVLVLEKVCEGVRDNEANRLAGQQALFVGCHSLGGDEFYQKTVQKLGLDKASSYVFDVKTKVLDSYPTAEAVEENLYLQIISSGKILSAQHAVTDESVKPNRRALVYGSGFSGLRAAMKLSEENIAVDIVETAADDLSPGNLGDNVLKPGLFADLREDAKQTDSIVFFPRDYVRQITPVEGGYILTTKDGNDREYGSIVFAPEREEGQKQEPKVLNLSQLFGIINALGSATAASASASAADSLKGDTVFLLDYGYETRPEIFRDVLLAARHIRKMHYAEVKVLLRSARVTIQDAQELYDECRELGVLFLKYEDLTIERHSGEIEIKLNDNSTSASLVITNPDRLIYPAKVDIPSEALEFARVLNLRILNDEYSQPDSLWLLPNETNRAGVFAVGASRGNMDARAIEEDAESLTFSLRRRLSSEELPIEEHIPEIDKEKCAYCLTCVRVCPFGAMTTDTVDRVAKVLKTACKACGICDAECPAQAIKIRNLNDESIHSAIKALLTEE